jgi:hypothetical protein
MAASSGDGGPPCQSSHRHTLDTPPPPGPYSSHTSNGEGAQTLSNRSLAMQSEVLTDSLVSRARRSVVAYRGRYAHIRDPEEHAWRQ